MNDTVFFYFNIKTIREKKSTFFAIITFSAEHEVSNISNNIVLYFLCLKLFACDRDGF